MKSNKLRFAELLKNTSVSSDCRQGALEKSSMAEIQALVSANISPKAFDSRGGRVIKVRLRDDTPRSHIRTLKNYLYSVEMLNDDIF
jgi:hypothetical protein